MAGLPKAFIAVLPSLTEEQALLAAAWITERCSSGFSVPGIGFGGVLNVLELAKFHRLMVANIKNWGVTHMNRRWMEHIGTAAEFTTADASKRRTNRLDAHHGP